MAQGTGSTAAKTPAAAGKVRNIVSHIDERNASGRLALAVYLVHGHPSVESSKQAFDALKGYDAIFECGLPITTFRTPFTSDTVKRAHDVAAGTALSDETFLSFYAGYRPNMLMNTEDENRRAGDRLLKQLEGSIDSLITDNPELAAMLDRSHAGHDETLPLHVQYVSALSETPERDFTPAPGDMLIYLGLADRIGGELLPLERIQGAIDAIAAAAPHAKILGGFGVRSAADVAYIRRLHGIHGIAIGTEAMDRLEAGLPAFEGWLKEIDRALAA